MKIIGIVLLVVGVAVAIFGIYQFVSFQQSVGGKAASIGRKLGSSKVAKGYVQPIIMVVAGIAAGAIGFSLFRRS